MHGSPLSGALQVKRHHDSSEKNQDDLKNHGVKLVNNPPIKSAAALEEVNPERMFKTENFRNQEPLLSFEGNRGPLKK